MPSTCGDAPGWTAGVIGGFIRVRIDCAYGSCGETKLANVAEPITRRMKQTAASTTLSSNSARSKSPQVTPPDLAARRSTTPGSTCLFAASGCTARIVSAMLPPRSWAKALTNPGYAAAALPNRIRGSTRVYSRSTSRLSVMIMIEITKHRRLDQRQVATANRLDQQPADTGPAEHRLDDDRAVQQ